MQNFYNQSFLAIEIMSSNFPWRNGYWYNKEQKSYITIVNGNEAVSKSHLCLDYPDLKPNAKYTWTYGDFGDTPEEIEKVTGAKKFNVQFGQSNVYGVLHECGTKLIKHGFGKNSPWGGFAAQARSSSFAAQPACLAKFSRHARQHSPVLTKLQYVTAKSDEICFKVA